MGLTLLIGGARSGKSSLALSLARPHDLVVFVATGEARDDEMVERVIRHQAERPEHWVTAEVPVRLDAAIGGAPRDACLVVDCLSLWVSNLFELGHTATEIEDEAEAVAQIVASRRATTIAVTNEVGLGIVPVTPLGRDYRDVLGRVNAIWAAAADEVFLVVAGRTLRLEAPNV
jgi:adenosyl cobinamide kinase/adenosyl cobinamide phosphate guanylyltransferase